jgi:hypothetical protein
MAPMMPAMPAAPPPMAYAPLAATSGSTLSMPTTGSMSSVEVRGPGLLSLGLARLGQRLIDLGQTRIRTVQETVLAAPRSQPSGGTTTISTTSLTPMQAPPSAPPAAPPAAPLAAPPAAPPEAPAPSPQCPQCQQKHSWIHHWLGHN